MATNNAVNVGLSGSTGTGAFVGSTSPTLVTPNLGTPSTLILTNATGDQIGVTDGSDAASGHVEEYIIQSALIGSAVSLTSGATSNVFLVTSALPRGDYDVYGTVIFNPDTTTTTTSMIAGLSSTSATLPTLGADNNTASINTSFAAGKNAILNVGPIRANSAFNQTIYLVAQATFAVSTMTVYGCMTARRRR